MAEEEDYIAGYDPFVISAELRNKKTDADLDAYYKSASGRGETVRGRSFLFPQKQLRLSKPNPDKYAMGLQTRREDFARDTANFEQDSQQLEELYNAEKQRRSSGASSEDSGDYLEFYLASSPKLDAAIASNLQAQKEYNKNYGFFGGVREAITGERAALDREYAANYERQRQLGDLKSKLYAADKAGRDLPQDLLDQYQSIGGEAYQPYFKSKQPAEPAPTTSNMPSDRSGSGDRIKSASKSPEVDAETPAMEPSVEPAQSEPSETYVPFSDSVEERFGELRIDDSQQEAMPEDTPSAEVEPVDEEAMERWRETLKGDFKKIMGSDFDPNSSVDFDKMKTLADYKRQNPELSTNALALKIYRSGAL